MERNQRIEEELFPFYALDALTADERAEVEGYVAANPEAELRLAEMVLAAAELSAATTPIAPSPAVKAGLMARIEAESHAEASEATVLTAPQTASPARRPPAARSSVSTRRSWWGFLAPALGALAALVLIASAFAVWRLWRQVNDLRDEIAVLQSDNQQLADQIDSLDAQNETLQRELAAREEILALFTTPGAVTVAIGDVSGQNPLAVGTLTLDPATDAATLRVANLPPPAAGNVYQAWIIDGETPLSAGTFTVDEDGRGSHPIPAELTDNIDAVGVSLEPSGGSDTPTPGNIILLGESF
jgi:anti-sigma-K factor RskA